MVGGAYMRWVNNVNNAPTKQKKVIKLQTQYFYFVLLFDDFVYY